MALVSFEQSSYIVAAPLRRSIPTSTPRGLNSASAEIYSDHSDQEASNIIDIDAVSGLGESAPTSLIRDRVVRSGKPERKVGRTVKERPDIGKTPVPRVKVERLSPVKKRAGLPFVDEEIGTSKERNDDLMTSGDEEQDFGHKGRRVRAFTAAGEPDEVNESQKVDLSESEEDEEEESMEGDFIATPGYVSPVPFSVVFRSDAQGNAGRSSG